MKDRVEKISSRLQQLRSIPLFSDLEEESLRRILEETTEFEANAGQVLVQPGQQGSGLFVVEEGTVVVELRGGARRELGAGEFFGEMSLLTPAVRTARVRAKTPVRCLAINRSNFEKLLEQEPKIAVAMLQTLARRLADTGTEV